MKRNSSRIGHGMQLIAVLIVGLAGAFSIAATPATQPVSSIPQSSIASKTPTTRPIKAKTPIPSDWVKLENSKYNYSFYVPKKWNKNVVNDTQAAYLLPAAKNKEPPLFLVFGAECHETTLDDEVATYKKSVADEHPKAKITKDQATTLGGMPAWLVVSEDPVTRTVPAQSPTQKPRTVTQKVTSMMIVYVQGKLSFNVKFVADSSAFSDNLTTAQRVIDSFAWSAAVKTDPAKTDAAKP